MTNPPSEKAVDAAVEQTFPASDPAKVMTDTGVRLDPEPLRGARPGALALRRLMTAALQSVHAAEQQSRDALQAIAELVAGSELRAALDGHLGGTERVLMRLTHALAYFGQGKRAELSVALSNAASGLGAAARDEAAGPALDCAVATSACFAERQKAAAYEVLVPLAQGLEAPDVVRLLEENLAETRAAVDQLARLAKERIIPEAASAAQPPLAERTNLLVFGASL